MVAYINLSCLLSSGSLPSVLAQRDCNISFLQPPPPPPRLVSPFASSSLISPWEFFPWSGVHNILCCASCVLSELTSAPPSSFWWITLFCMHAGLCCSYWYMYMYVLVLYLLVIHVCTCLSKTLWENSWIQEKHYYNCQGDRSSMGTFCQYMYMLLI